MITTLQSMRQFGSLLLLLMSFVRVGNALDKAKAIFPTNDEISLFVTQTDRAVQQYKPLIDTQENQLGNGSNEAAAKDRQVVQALELVIKALRANPQGFNSPAGFSFLNGWMTLIVMPCFVNPQRSRDRLNL